MPIVLGVSVARVFAGVVVIIIVARQVEPIARIVIGIPSALIAVSGLDIPHTGAPPALAPATVLWAVISPMVGLAVVVVVIFVWSP